MQLYTKTPILNCEPTLLCKIKYCQLTKCHKIYSQNQPFDQFEDTTVKNCEKIAPNGSKSPLSYQHPTP